MRTYMTRPAFFILGLFFSSFGFALQAPDFAELSNHAKHSVSNYRLVISTLKRQNAQTFGEKERRLKGKLWRRQWLAIKGYDLDEIQRFFLKQLKTADILYQCQNRDCGSSQFWANKVFEQPALLGRDNHQRYFVALKKGNPNQFYIFYAAKRHTGQIRFQLDILSSTENPNPQAVSSQSLMSELAKGSGWLTGFYTTAHGGLDLEKSQTLIDALNRLPTSTKQRLYLVVHDYQNLHMQDNIRGSQALALQLKQQTKLDVRGLGALTLSPDESLKPKLRFVLWPKH